MGLLNKIFKGSDRDPGDSALSGSRFEESTDVEDGGAERDAARRDLVRLVLRETMQRHAVPSDWVECRLLPVITSQRNTGLHVQLVVVQGQGNLLGYIPAFQSNLMAELEKHDHRVWDWLLSISWQFAGITSATGGELPSRSAWQDPAPVKTVGRPGGAEDLPPVEDDLAKDLEALFAIRDAALQRSAPGKGDHGFEPTRPAFVASRNDPQR